MYTITKKSKTGKVRDGSEAYLALIYRPLNSNLRVKIVRLGNFFKLDKLYVIFACNL